MPAALTFNSTNFYSGQVNATCNATALPAAQCTLSPANPITINAGASVPVAASINVPNSAGPGTYNIVISSQDITGAPSSTFTIALTVYQDFTVSSLTPATQTITPGESASYNFSILPVGASFTNAVTLSCSSTPVIAALCSFTPSSVTPGNSSTAVVMTIATTSSSASLFPSSPNRAVFLYASSLALPGLALLATKGRGRRRARRTLQASGLGLILLALLLPSCGAAGSNGGGGGGGGGGGQQQGTQPGTYTITVTGTSGTLSHQAPSTITLVVSP